MNGILNTAVSALNAFGTGMMSIANNVANINTDDFKADRVHYQDAPHNGGVQVGDISKDTSAGAPVPAPPQDTVDISYLAAEEAADAAALQQAEAYRDAEMRESSNVQLEREFTNLIAHEQAYAASAALVRTYDDMMGTVVDMVV